MQRKSHNVTNYLEILVTSGKLHQTSLPRTHPDPLHSQEWDIAQESWFGSIRSWFLVLPDPVLLAASRVVLPAAVVHVEQQSDHIDDVDVEKHHHDHEVGAGADAALVTGQTLALRPPQGWGCAACIQSRILCILLVVWHLQEEAADPSAAKLIGLFPGRTDPVKSEVADVHAG